MFFPKRIFSYLLIFSLTLSSLVSLEPEEEGPPLTNIAYAPKPDYSAPAKGLDSSLAVSMMLWGVGLAIGIAVLSVLVESSSEDVTPAHSHVH